MSICWTWFYLTWQIFKIMEWKYEHCYHSVKCPSVSASAVRWLDVCLGTWPRKGPGEAAQAQLPASAGWPRHVGDALQCLEWRVQYTTAATLQPSLCRIERCHYRITALTTTLSVTLFKKRHSQLSDKWHAPTICLSLVDTFSQNLSLPLIGWHSCQLSVSIPAPPPASTLDMLSWYMRRTIVRHKFSLTFRTEI